jgi:phenylacetate-CoA ligase
VHASLLRLYHAAPHPLRQAAASLRGLYLRRWRYGPETDRLADEAVEREAWSEERWDAWRQETLARLLHRAATKVPYYREHWSARQRAGDSSSFERLESWPVLPKRAVRENPRAFLAEDADPREMFRESTSGTTGSPLTLWWSRETVRRWYALFEARVRGWNGVSRRDRWAMLGGQLVCPVARRRPPFWVENLPLGQLYLSSYHLSPSYAHDYASALRRFRPTYLFGYASSLHALAEMVRESGLPAPPLKVAISNAEPLWPHQRAAIGEVFGCPVRDTYGMAEIALAGSECAHGRMHAWPEVGLLETLSDTEDAPAPSGTAGRFVATGLLNPDMPLIRYDTGDRGTALAGGGCSCGRSLPVFGEIEGRSDDVLVTPDGRRVGRLDPVFKEAAAVREAQIVQESPRLIRVRVVPAERFQAADAARITQALRQRIGEEIEIVVETVPEISRGSAGKFRAVVRRNGKDAA